MVYNCPQRPPATGFICQLEPRFSVQDRSGAGHSATIGGVSDHSESFASVGEFLGAFSGTSGNGSTGSLRLRDLDQNDRSGSFGIARDCRAGERSGAQEALQSRTLPNAPPRITLPNENNPERSRRVWAHVS